MNEQTPVPPSEPSQPAPTAQGLPGVQSLEEILRRLLLQKFKVVPNAEYDEQQKREQAQNRRGRILTLQAECGAPKLHWNAKDLDRSDRWGEIEKKIIEKLGKGGFLGGLLGVRGNGKTQLAIEAMRYVMSELVRSARYVTATGLIADLKATFKSDSDETERDVVRRCARYGLLVIDEFARRGEGDWENNLLFELLNRRYADQKDTILIANQEREEFIRAIGPSLASRMSEKGAIIECDWPSYR